MALRCDPNPRESEEASLAFRPRERRETKLRSKLRPWGWGLCILIFYIWTSLVAQMVKRLPTMQTLGSVPGSERSPGEGNGNPLQYSCLENSMDREAW